MRLQKRILPLLLVACLAAAEPLKLQVNELEPRRSESRGTVLFADFGKDAYGSLKLEVPKLSEKTELTVRLGEKRGPDGLIDRKPGGSINYREVVLALEPGRRDYRLELASKPFHLRGPSVRMPEYVGEVTPFRYVEIEGPSELVDKIGLRRTFVHAPFDDDAADFECSDETLNEVWELCKYTMKASSAFGVYIDGERERIPYEADAYLNQLSHYACDLDPRVARLSIDWLLEHPTWPTEWSLHMPMMAAADYMATGDNQVARKHFETLKRKLLSDKAREDGLLRACGIVDWPAAERDGYNEGRPSNDGKQQVGPEINTVVNAFYYHALRQMALLANSLKKDSEAAEWNAMADRVEKAFNRVFWDSARGLYIDGEGSSHASLHANFFPAAFGLVPEDRKASVADFIQSRGMACSVYGAQYLLEALFLSGRDGQAVRLMTARTKRSWWHMIELGSTMTLEAWDAEYKPNLTWNHAWGAAPANILPRYLLGVRPASPGYARILIAPKLGGLKMARGKVPTPLGPVFVRAEDHGAFSLELELPPGAKADVVLPARAKGQVRLDGKAIRAQKQGEAWLVENLQGGKYRLESL